MGLRQDRSMYPHLLFTVDASQVDLALVRSFLNLDIAENFTVDYKRNIDGALETVAAMANTYGGMILVGVDANSQVRDRPGSVVGVPAGEERLVNKLAGVFDPPWWCPEVIPMQKGDGDKVVLIVRVDADRAPRPILHKGSVMVRLDGRNATADRRIVRVLFEESGHSVSGLQTVSHWPDQHKPPFHRLEPPPDIVVRAFCCQPLRSGPVRPRLGGNVAAGLGVDGPPSARLISLLSRLNSAEVINSWQLDGENLHSRFLRLSAGHGTTRKPIVPGARIECSVELTGVGTHGMLETCVDALFWRLPGERLPSDDMIQAAHEVVYLLTQQTHPATTTAVLGKAMRSIPPVELHVAGRPDPYMSTSVSLDKLIDLNRLGQRIGTQPAYRAGEFLRQDLIDTGDWHGAVTDALTVIAMDWRFPSPLIS
jgi:hypothetical protein